MKVDREKFRRLLRLAREFRGFSIRGAAIASGISPSTIRNIEHGRREGQFKNLMWLSETYGFRLSGLIQKCEIEEGPGEADRQVLKHHGIEYRD